MFTSTSASPSPECLEFHKLKNIDLCSKGPELKVRGQSGFMDPEAYFRELNNLNCAQRGGVALQHEENGDEKGKLQRAKGISRNHP